MSLMITDECITCDECERICPCGAISSRESGYQVDLSRCNECREYYDSPQCIEVCPIDGCFVKVPDTMQADELERMLSSSDPVVRARYANHTGCTGAQCERGLRDSAAEVRAAFQRARPLTLLQIEQALHDPSATNRLWIAEHYDLLPEQAARVQEDQDESVRAISYRRFPIAPDQLAKGLQETSTWIRCRVLEKSEPSAAQLRVLIQDADADVRKLAVTKLEFPSEMLGLALADSHPSVRLAAARRVDLPLNKAQIEQGMADNDPSVRLAILERGDYTPTEADFERWMSILQDKERVMLLSRAKGALSPAQFLRYLADTNGEVRCAVMARPEVLTMNFEPDVVERGLTDAEPKVRQAFASRRDVPLSRSQVTRGIKDRAIETILLARPDVRLSKTQDRGRLTRIEHGLKSLWSGDRAEFARRTDYIPTPEQIERGLTDRWLIVRQAFYERKDIVLTEAQRHRALESADFSVTESTEYEEYGEDYIVSCPKCPHCGVYVFGSDMEEKCCEHLAFIYLNGDGLYIGSAATNEQIDWLNESESRSKFIAMCRAFKLKLQHHTEEGMACGPVSVSMIFAYEPLSAPDLS